MAFTEQELAHEAERRKFYDPLIIRQFERKHQTPLAVTMHESSAKDQLDKLAYSTMFDTTFCALFGGIATFCAEVWAKPEMLNFNLSSDVKACIFGATAITVAGFLELTTSPMEN